MIHDIGGRSDLVVTFGPITCLLYECSQLGTRDGSESRAEGQPRRRSKEIACTILACAGAFSSP